MEKPIVPIPRVMDSWILGLIKMGILEVSEDGLHCKEDVQGPAI